MQALYEQLRALQQIPNAYEEWAAYRNALTDFIVGHTAKGASALIVGAGACNDFDLLRMTEHFSEVTLLDRDADAMREGCDRQGIPCGAVRTVRADLLGIPDTDYAALCDAMLLALRERTVQTDADIGRLFLLHMETAFRNRASDLCLLREGAADYVICCGVHSQLIGLFPQMAGVYRRYASFDEEAVYAAARAGNAVLARELNNRLFQMANTGVILGLEKSRLDMEGGIEGAAQALADIEARDVTIRDEGTLLWPFDRSQGKIYTVKVLLAARNGAR